MHGCCPVRDELGKADRGRVVLVHRVHVLEERVADNEVAAAVVSCDIPPFCCSRVITHPYPGGVGITSPEHQSVPLCEMVGSKRNSSSLGTV